MKHFTGFVILTGGSLVVGCASQAPAPSAATAVSHEAVAATSTGTSANSANLGNVAATSTTASSTGTSANQASAPATASAAPQKAKFVIPDGYDEVVIRGRKVYCLTEAPTGTRIQHRSCRTEAQLQAQQEAAQRLIETMGQKGSAMGAASLGAYGEGTQLAGPGYYQPPPR